MTLIASIMILVLIIVMRLRFTRDSYRENAEPIAARNSKRVRSAPNNIKGLLPTARFCVERKNIIENKSNYSFYNSFGLKKIYVLAPRVFEFAPTWGLSERKSFFHKSTKKETPICDAQTDQKTIDRNLNHRHLATRTPETQNVENSPGIPILICLSCVT